MKNKTTFLWIGFLVLLVAFILTWAGLQQHEWVYKTLGALTLLVALGLGYEYRKAFGTRSAKIGLSSAVSIVLVIGIVGVINFLASRDPMTYDVTRNKVHTFSEQTEKLVKGLSTEVQATFFTKLPANDQFQGLLKRYENLNSLFKVEFVDPNRDLARTKEAGIKRLDTLYLAVGTKTQLIESPDEEKITNALIKMTSSKSSVLCSISGHGEKEFTKSDAEGYSEAKSGLEAQSYEVRPVNLPQEGKIPDNCDAIAILGPQKAFFQPEIQAIDDYLTDGGRAIIALDVNVQGGDGARELTALMEKWGVIASNALVLDPLSRGLGSSLTIPIIANFNKTHSVTKEFGMQCYFPLARPLKPTKDHPGLTVNWLGKTLPSAWAESNFEGLKKGQVQNPPDNQKGEQMLAVAVDGKIRSAKTPPKRDTRLVVFGTSALATNAYTRAGGNLDLFLNAVSWTLENENLISIRKKDDDKVELTHESGMVVFWISVVLAPLMIMAAGIANWARRRKL